MITYKNKLFITNKILKNIEEDYLNIVDLDEYLKEKIDIIYDKLKSDTKNFEQIAIYDKKFNIFENPDRDIIFEDFLGKNQSFNTYNSTEQNSIYFHKTNKNNTVDYIFKKTYKNTLYNISNFIANFYFLNKKHFFSLLTLNLINLFPILYYIFFTAIFGIIDLFFYFLFIIMKVFIKKKYKIIKIKTLLPFKYLLNINILFLKYILMFIKGILNIINNFFNNISYIFYLFDKVSKRNIYSNILKNKLNRNKRTFEHRNVLMKINNIVKNNFYKKNVHNIQYLQQFNFLKINKEILIPENIENKIFKEYFLTLEKIEKRKIIKIIKNKVGKNIKNKIYEKEINYKLDKLKTNYDRLFDFEKKVNKHLKKIFDNNNIINSCFNKEIKKEL